MKKYYLIILLLSLCTMGKSYALNVKEFKSLCKTDFGSCSRIARNTTTSLGWGYFKATGKVFYCEKKALKQSDKQLATQFIQHSNRMLPSVFSAVEFPIAYMKFLRETYPLETCSS